MLYIFLYVELESKLKDPRIHDTVLPYLYWSTNLLQLFERLL